MVVLENDYVNIFKEHYVISWKWRNADGARTRTAEVYFGLYLSSLSASQKLIGGGRGGA